MASIVNDGNGRRRIQFVNPDGDRKQIRLGKVSQRSAESIKLRVEQLLECLNLRQPMQTDLAQWVADMEPKLSKKFAQVGLISQRSPKRTVTLGEQLDTYFTRRTDVKKGTLLHWQNTKRCLLEFFEAARTLKSITSGEAQDFERWLRTGAARVNRYADNSADEGLASNTVRKRISNTKQFFQDAVQREILTRNPFAGLKGTVGNNRDRDFFITREMARAIEC